MSPPSPLVEEDPVALALAAIDQVAVVQARIAHSNIDGFVVGAAVDDIYVLLDSSLMLSLTSRPAIESLAVITPPLEAPRHWLVPRTLGQPISVAAYTVPAPRAKSIVHRADLVDCVQLGLQADERPGVLSGNSSKKTKRPGMNWR